MAKPNRSEQELEMSVIMQAIANRLVSPNESDSNGEVANVVDGLFAIARGLHAVAKAIEKTK
jgi:hypothetical protein